MFHGEHTDGKDSGVQGLQGESHMSGTEQGELGVHGEEQISGTLQGLQGLLNEQGEPIEQQLPHKFTNVLFKAIFLSDEFW